jgi:hypothetical protein
MHSKAKGSLGEISAAAQLISEGYAVFTELGDLSRTDLIVLVDNKPIKVQVKARHLVNGVIHATASKAGPNYRFRYSKEDFDVFALYCIDTKDVFFVNASDVLKQESFSLRVDDAKNRQKKGVHKASDYKDFRKALRGHTLHTPPDNAGGEEMVQTTTESIPASES